MWNGRERSRPATHGMTHLELARVSDALVIFDSRRRLGADVTDPNGQYSPQRDSTALQQGIRILEVPTETAKRVRFETSMGNVIDWSKRPENVPHGVYMNNVVESMRQTISAILSGRGVDGVDLRDTVTFFRRLSAETRNQLHIPQPIFERGTNYLLERLHSCREGIDAVDSAIIGQAEERGFEAVLLDLHRITDIEVYEEKPETKSDLTIAVSQRRKISAEIAEIKFAFGAGTLDRRREQEMKDVRYEWGRDIGLTEDEVDKLMTVLMDDSKRIQGEIQGRLLALKQ
jgi:chorismate mutase